MKRILSILALMFTLSVFVPQIADAQVYTYRTTQYAYKKTDSHGNWTQWSNWVHSNLTVIMNLDNDRVTILSSKRQVYQITKHIRNFTDSSGGKQVEFAFVDNEYDRGHMRLRIETNGNSQLYVEYANLILVWNVVRTN